MLVSSRSFGSGTHEPVRSKPRTKKPSSDTTRERHLASPSTRPATPPHHKPFGWRPSNFTPLPSTRRPPPREKSNDSVTSPKARDTSPTPALADKANAITTPSPTARSMPRPIANATKAHPRDHRKDAGHDASALTPSMAALLAMTTIPKRKKDGTRKASRPSPSRMTAQELREEWLRLDASLTSPSSSISPAMDVLLSPPGEEDNLFEVGGSLDESLCQSSRSTSSNSIPGLDRDDSSYHSWNTPPTPPLHPFRRANVDKRERVVSSPEAVCGLLNHPLSPDSSLDLPDDADEGVLDKGRAASPSPARSSRTASPAGRFAALKSNLTASLDAVRKAAISFSNFAAPSIVPDDHITRGFTGAAPWRSEMRPRQLPETPTPAMRRYFSPGSKFVPPARDFHMHGTHLDHTDLEAAAYAIDGAESEFIPPGAVIAMQDYVVPEAAPGSTSDKRSTFMTEAGRTNQDLQQRREPRENNEFLRICVLEMNMRRSGKMEGPLGVGPGRKAWWLPPRRTIPVIEGKEAEVLDGGKGRKIPERWKGISVSY